MIDSGQRMHFALPVDARNRRFTSFRRCSRGTTSLENRHFGTDDSGEPCNRRITQVASLGDVRSRWYVPPEAEAKAARYGIVLALIISSGVMWSTETKQATRGNIIYDSLGSSEGVSFAGSISVPEPSRKLRVHDRRAQRCSPTTVVVVQVDWINMLAVGGHIRSVTTKDEQSAATFREINALALPVTYASGGRPSIVLLGAARRDQLAAKKCTRGGRSPSRHRRCRHPGGQRSRRPVQQGQMYRVVACRPARCRPEGVHRAPGARATSARVIRVRPQISAADSKPTTSGPRRSADTPAN